MILAMSGIIPPKEWIHDSTLCDNFGNTVAMVLAWYGTIPLKEWLHDPSL